MASCGTCGTRRRPLWACGAGRPGSTNLGLAIPGLAEIENYRVLLARAIGREICKFRVTDPRYLAAHHRSGRSDRRGSRRAVITSIDRLRSGPGGCAGPATRPAEASGSSQSCALARGEAAPHPVVDVGRQRVGEAVQADVAAGAHRLRRGDLACRFLFRFSAGKEGLGPHAPAGRALSPSAGVRQASGTLAGRAQEHRPGGYVSAMKTSSPTASIG